MNAAHIHLMLNHLPVIGLLFATVLLFVGTARNDASLLKAGWVVLIFAALIAVPVLKSGENAEEIVEKINEVDHSVVHEHEEAAEKSIYLLFALALSSGVSWLLYVRKQWSAIRGYLLALGSLVGFAYMCYVAYTGGLIRHPEIGF
jgi:uncharacterized membrane protein